jgi:hypothetical protein
MKMVSIADVIDLAAKVGVDLTVCVTRAEMKRVVLYHFDRLDRAERFHGRRMKLSKDQINLLDALAINSFKDHG